MLAGGNSLVAPLQVGVVVEEGVGRVATQAVGDGDVVVAAVEGGVLNEPSGVVRIARGAVEVEAAVPIQTVLEGATGAALPTGYARVAPKEEGVRVVTRRPGGENAAAVKFAVSNVGDAVGVVVVNVGRVVAESGPFGEACDDLSGVG